MDSRNTFLVKVFLVSYVEMLIFNYDIITEAQSTISKVLVNWLIDFPCTVVVT